MAKEPSFREFEHTGDAGIELTASSRAELFGRALVALARLMVEESGIEAAEQRQIRACAESDADLMHDLLAFALNVFLIDTFIWRDASVVEGPGRLDATLLGERFDPRRHRLLTEIKAVTYHQLSVEHRNSLWRSRIVVDV